LRSLRELAFTIRWATTLYWLISSEASAANEQAQDTSIVASKKTECMPRDISRYILFQTLDRVILARLESAWMYCGVSCLQIIAFAAGIVIGDDGIPSCRIPHTQVFINYSKTHRTADCRACGLSQEPRRSPGDSIGRYAAIRVSILPGTPPHSQAAVRPRIPLCFAAM